MLITNENPDRMVLKYRFGCLGFRKEKVFINPITRIGIHRKESRVCDIALSILR